MPLLRNTDKSKISKRKNPAARLTWFQEQGYLPEALVNFLALLAYPPAEGAEGDGRRGVRASTEFIAALRLGERQPGRPDLRPQEARLAQRRLHPRARGRRLRRRGCCPTSQADGVLGDNPSLGELARLQAVTELIQTRMAQLTEATDLVGPFYVADDAARDRRRRPRPAQGRRRRGARRRRQRARGHRRRAHRGARHARARWTAAAIEAALREAIVDGLGIKPKFAFGPLRTAVSGRSGCRRRCSSRWRSWARPRR